MRQMAGFLPLDNGPVKGTGSPPGQVWAGRTTAPRTGAVQWQVAVAPPIPTNPLDLFS